MSILSKDEWEHRAHNVELRNADNREILIDKLGDEFKAEEMANAMAALAEFRHNFHTNGFNGLKLSESSNYDYFNQMLHTGVHEILKEGGINNNLIFDTDELVNDSFDDDMLLEFEMSREEADDQIAEFVEDTNTTIEKFMREFDSKYGTHYAPTGVQRL